MPRNGTGGYSLPNNSWNPAVNGNAATAADWQTLANDIQAAIQQSVSSDGQTPMTGSLKMGGYAITQLGAPTGTGQSLRWEQLIKGSDIASASLITIPNEGSLFDVTGTTTINTLDGSAPGRTVTLRFTGTVTLTNSASLVLPNGKNLIAYPNETYVFCQVTPGVWQFCGGTFMLPSKFRQGGVITTTTNTATVAAGAWRSSANDTNLVLTSAMTKTLQTSGAWAAGSGNNGLFSGAAAVSTWYHVFVIRNTTTGAVDVGFDTSPTAANIPSGYVAYRRVGAIFNQAGGTIRSFLQDGNLFRNTAPIINLNNNGLGAPNTVVVSCPTGVRCLANLTAVVATQATYGTAFVYATDESDRTSDSVASAFGGAGFLTAGHISVLTNTSAQVMMRGTGSIPSGAFLSTNSYVDFIGD
ncbi:hypothetical protein [Achromobacter ruhlandii]|uniref:Phage tail protein n=1 Tax=Achromobacter ruhlandii TaxID=72557 RepID=A0ABM8M3W0_9BURK|nr:hypothetical protein [Achromobacter ruhlandii]MCZ8431756.1 hypothetical protein [Achromobacter ruhlandii]MDC6090393.1 hypothetical protein [Achromobacter ruhlandii]MDC6149382.1 hypothetical protein [Achromobacter ruhlandii]MDD7977635.1 hypothetical protein [Achromobacter ruhlandii]WIW04133.1 hypothetical protein PPH40_005760 [Achromobacter ruhlandii]